MTKVPARLHTGIVAFVLALIASTFIGAPPAHGAGPGAVIDHADCTATAISANDDGSSPRIDLPFTMNFFGREFDHLWVNNNGNITFDGALSTFTPFGIQSAGVPIIAPFFADVDTRAVGTNGSDVVRYGYGLTTYEGRPAFCASWVNVGYYSHGTDRLNSFQALIVDRSDVAPGDVDIVFNYDQVQWETGSASGGTGGLGGSSARVGFSNGDTTSFELPGSASNGAFLDSNADTGLIHRSLDSLQLGRYVFRTRSGEAPIGRAITGNVVDETGDGVSDSLVSACAPSGLCRSTRAGAGGAFAISGLPPSDYTLRAFSPASSSLFPGTLGPLALDADDLTGRLIVLSGPTGPPPGTSITSRGTTADGIPVVYWGEDLELVTTACPGGVASFTITDAGGAVLRSGPMSEDPSGTYSAMVPALRPVHGLAEVVIDVDCPAPTPDERIAFDIYIDPSGTVRTMSGSPIPDATVTLYRADEESGPFTVVPDGSAIMSPSNRSNPDSTDAGGHFGWDTIAGFYVVRAEADGCHAPDDEARLFVETDVLPVPPEHLDLLLVLDCGVENTPPVLNVPDDFTVEGNTTGGAVVEYDVTVSDAEDDTPPSAVCSPASGTLFGLGTTAVTCSATDGGPDPMTTEASFEVTVQDTVAPLIACPAMVHGVVGSAVDLGSPDVRDVVDAAPTVTNDAPASFGPGATTVSWTATDASGNASRCAQQVSLTYQFDGFRPPVRDGMSVKAGSTVPVKWVLRDAGGMVTDTSVIVSARFDHEGGQYTVKHDGEQFHVNAKTAKSWRGTGVFTLELDDGTTQRFTVELR